MSRLKTFGKYILLIAAFFFFSRILIFIGLNNTYDNINLVGTLPQGVSINSAKATAVNGELKGNISKEISEKYVKFNFYSDINTLAGSYYITPSELKDNSFEFYFKLNYIKSYGVELTNEKTETNVNLEDFSSGEFSKALLLSLFFRLIFI